MEIVLNGGDRDGPRAAAGGQAASDGPSAERPRRAIRSYVLRRSHFSPAQRDAYQRLLPRFGVAFTGQPVDPVALFGRAAPLILEIGFGMGDTTAEIAAAAPAFDFLAIDVHTPGVGALLKRIEQGGLDNIRVIEHDASAVVDAMIAPNSLTGIHVFFPDPWPKARHHKRRLLQQQFVTELVERLRPGGYLHFATDWPDYAEQVAAIVDARPGLGDVLAAAPAPPVVPIPPGPATRPGSDASGNAEAAGAAAAPRWLPGTRPATRFEARGQRLGHPITDLIRVRGAAPHLQ
ncbi:MAG: tRNA (guanosine(46)-N7)-methyltransferase TrmB [Lautropia sp.]